MSVRIVNWCRWGSKVFLEVAVEGLPQSSEAELLVTDSAGREVPSLLIPYDASGSLGKSPLPLFIAIVPELDVDQRLIFFFQSQGEIFPLGEQMMSAGKAKWLSRLNKLVRGAAVRTIKDYDVSHTLNRAVLAFTDCVLGKTALPGSSLSWHYVVQGKACVPCGVSNASFVVKCFDGRFEEIPVGVHVGESTLVSESANKSTPYREWRLTLRIPPERKLCLVALYNENGQLIRGFEVLDSFKLDYLKRETPAARASVWDDPGYSDWFYRHRATASELAVQRATRFSNMPLFSVVVPLYKTSVSLLMELVQSIVDQSYERWELILVNGSPGDDDLAFAVERLVEGDDRISAINLDENRGISLNTNAGIEAASGDYIVFVDHDDLVEPDALFEYARVIGANPATDLLYCDEDHISQEGVLCKAFFKPNFSIDMVRSVNYLCHMLVVRASLVREVGMLDPRFDGAQDHDLVLKVAERSSNIVHINKVLYHWRDIPGSTALQADEKPYAFDAGMGAVSAHLERSGVSARVFDGGPSVYRVDYLIQENPLVSIVIPSKDAAELLDACLSSIEEKTLYSNYEVVVVENNSEDEGTFDYYKSAVERNSRVRVVSWVGEGFNYSSLVNFGVQEARGDYIVLLNNDIEVISPDWLDVMLGYALQEGVGAVGARLRYPNDTLQHTGIALSPAGHVCSLEQHLSADDGGYYQQNKRPHEVSAVTAACMLTSREVFNLVGGFNEELAIACNDVDYCLRLWDEGLRVMYVPYAELYHHESVTRGYEIGPEKQARLISERGYLLRRWGSKFAAGDVYLNPNFGSEYVESSYCCLGWEPISC